VASPPPEAPGERQEAAGGRREIDATTSERATPLGGIDQTVAPVGGVEPAAGRGARGPRTGVGTDERPARTQPLTADPAPLGLAAFALTTFMLSLFNAGLLDEAGQPVVFGLALAYGGLAQLLAGMWEFRTGNTFGATAFTSYGAFWISFFVLEVFFADEIPASDMPIYLGWFLIAWGVFTTYMYIASFKVTGAVNVVFLLLAATLYLLGLGDLAGAETITRIGGFVGIATAVAAWYASFAIVTNETLRQKVLPVKELENDRADGRS